MDRRLGIALAAALGMALFVIAYLLGRESARDTPAVVVLTPAPAGEAAPAPGASGEGPASIDADAAAPAAATQAPATEPAATTGAGETASAAEPPGPAGQSSREEVARYFREVEALQQAAKGWTGDANAAAQEIVRDAASGDTSGLQRLVDANRRLAEGLRAVQAPAACAPHLQMTLETLAEADRILARMKTSLQSQDVAGLSQLAAAGQDVERRAKETDALAAEIKKRYGI